MQPEDWLNFKLDWVRAAKVDSDGGATIFGAVQNWIWS
jgi:hypothetical protein